MIGHNLHINVRNAVKIVQLKRPEELNASDQAMTFALILNIDTSVPKRPSCWKIGRSLTRCAIYYSTFPAKLS
jgi:hypothetical protein